LLHYQRVVGRFPPIARKKSRHHSITIRSLPHERAARLQNSSEFPDDARVVRRIFKKSERGEEIHYSVELARPPRGKLSHVSSHVVKRRALAALLRERNQMVLIIDPVDDEAGVSEKMRVPALSAWRVEYA